MKVLHPRDRFQIVLPVHRERMKTKMTENAFNLLLRMCRRRYLNINLWACTYVNIQLPIHNQASKERDTNKNNNTFSFHILRLRSHDQSFSKVCVFSELDSSTQSQYCECFQKFAFSVNVAFSNLSTLESILKSFRFHWKRYIVFIRGFYATKCLRFQMKTHSCGQGLSIRWRFIFAVLSFLHFFHNSNWEDKLYHHRR